MRDRNFPNLFDQCKTCEMASKLAIEDFNHSKFQIVRWGLPDSGPSLRDTVLAKDFKIKILHGGCVGFKEVDCYNYSMLKLLYAKYGEKIFPL